MPSEQTPSKINKWDGSAVKNSIDDAIRKYMTDIYGYKERTALHDGRLAISVFAVGVAMFALLWDWLHPFPASRSVLIICVLSYFVLMVILQAYVHFVEKNTFFVAVDQDPSRKRPDVKWRFASVLKKYDDMYELDVWRSSSGDGRHSIGNEKLTKSISGWFDEEGYLVEQKLHHDLKNLVMNIGDKKYQ